MVDLLHGVYTATRLLVGCSPFALATVVASFALLYFGPLFVVVSRSRGWSNWVYQGAGAGLYLLPFWLLWSILHYADATNSLVADATDAFVTLRFSWVDAYIPVAIVAAVVVLVYAVRFDVHKDNPGEIALLAGLTLAAPAAGLGRALTLFRKLAAEGKQPGMWARWWASQIAVSFATVCYLIWAIRMYYWTVSPATCITYPLHFRLLLNPLQLHVLYNVILVKILALTVLLDVELPLSTHSTALYAIHVVFAYQHSAIGLAMVFITADIVKRSSSDAYVSAHASQQVSFSATAALGRIAATAAAFSTATTAWFALNLTQVEALAVLGFLLAILYLAPYGNAPHPEVLGKWILDHWLQTAALAAGAVALVFAAFTHWGLVPWEVELFSELFVSNNVFKLVALTFKVAVGGGTIWAAMAVYKARALKSWLRLLILIPAALLFLHALTRYTDQCSLVPGEVYPEANEAQSIAELIDTTTSIVKELDLNTAYRDVHRKMHGCVRGEFRVNDWVPEHLKVGLFANPGESWPAWVRFSNGMRKVRNDARPDVRGMAIKLCGVAGEKAATFEPFAEPNTADFVLVSSKTFFANSISAYPKLLKAIVAGGLRTLFTLGPMFYSGFVMSNPLTTEYFSVTPYALGSAPPVDSLYDLPLAVKYGVRPCAVNSAAVADDEIAWGSSPDFLREAMTRWLDAGEACFEFGIAEQGLDACKNPLEDIAVRWTDKTGYNDVVYVPVARLTIPQQTFDYVDQFDFCRDLSFNIWHTPVSHRPLGSIAKARKFVYNATATLRRTLNSAVVAQPTCTETFSGRRVGQLAGQPDIFDYATMPVPFSYLPRFIRDIPQSQQYEFKFYSSHGAVFAGALAKSLLRVKDAPRPISEWESPDEWAVVFDAGDTNSSVEALHANLFTLPIPYGYHNWTDDMVWARTYLTGTNPVILQRVLPTNPLPAALDMAPSSVAAANAFLASKGLPPMDELSEAGQLYFADYELLADAITKDDFIMYAPVVVFYLDTVNVAPGSYAKLMPLAIQLTRGTRAAEAGPHVWHLPSDPAESWLFAKMHVASSDVQWHEAGAHLGPIHLTMEPFLIAFFRSFAKDHPMYVFLKPHTYDTFAVNNMGRYSLVARKGAQFENLNSIGLDGVLELMERNYNDYWTWEGFAFPQELADRGFTKVTPGSPDDPLPGYYYRDDGFVLWDAIENYANRAVDIMYASDADLVADDQFNGFMAELRSPHGANITSIPDVKTRPELARFLTRFLFTVTAQHAAVSLSQYDYYAFAPSRPTLMRKPMPINKSEVTLRYIMDSLPDARTVTHSLGLVRLLSTPTLGPGGSYSSLLQVPVADMFKPAYLPFQERCKEIEASILARNAAAEDPYLFLRPSQVPYSLSS
ncbi:arachidonate 12-lipoxygenase [Thecamonas trahens ATCC 50062]|uniref:Arachidonate 12-lipoxygenase n=1 Tax=Thecamonas trahens ATCC 50062 TaxID=461836 RepID=A0A0L0DEV1_THETB|nr:arachidonate 12-lipoxygenase [Thecamonas trahens ATCC 50062]KNC50819.1 arachidonate 12-lipoxygenase [Thecamonas trahens ATCC 50062]|eukprot:XP_013756774.1 arachidonate 12-lipoxygenase [Thecamonas trahens ATCC 50062]